MHHSIPPERRPRAGGGAIPAAELRLMNGFELLRDGRSVPCPLTAQRLLAFLAFQERPVQRLYVAGRLWPDASEQRALASLRSALWRANRPAGRLVEAVDTRIALDPAVRVDAREGALGAQRLIDGPAAAGPPPGAPLPLGELLPDWYDDWLVFERERLRQLHLHALEALTARLMAGGRYGEAVSTALSAIAVEPLRESAHRALIGVHLAEGNPSEARRSYELFRELLRSELGLCPSARLAEMVEPLGVGDDPVTDPRELRVGAR